ncbi:MAG: hypothetical protein R2769_01625 [Saprospiraceae bacterium]
MIILGNKEYFKGIGKIAYEGRDSDNPMAFKWYDADKVVRGKTMKDYFRFAMAWWHTLCGTGGDPFGVGTKQFPWLEGNDPNEIARNKMDAGFEFLTKMGLPFYCFHDFDLVDEASTIAESRKRLEIITDYALEKQEASE